MTLSQVYTPKQKTTTEINRTSFCHVVVSLSFHWQLTYHEKCQQFAKNSYEIFVYVNVITKNCTIKIWFHMVWWSSLAMITSSLCCNSTYWYPSPTFAKLDNLEHVQIQGATQDHLLKIKMDVFISVSNNPHNYNVCVEITSNSHVTHKLLLSCTYLFVCYISLHKYTSIPVCGGESKKPPRYIW